MFSDSELEDGSEDGTLWIGDDVVKKGDDAETLSWGSDRADGPIKVSIWKNKILKYFFN